MTFTTAAEAVEHICSTEPIYALDTASIRGIEYKVFKNVPRHMGEFLAVCEQHGDLDFVVYQDERLTFRQFREKANQLAQALMHECGVRPGDKVAVSMRNYPEYLLLIMAITSIGGVIVFLNSWWTSDEMEYGFTDSGARLAFLDGPRAKVVAPFAARLGIRQVIVRDSALPGTMAFDDLMAKAPSNDVPDVDIDTDADMAVMYTSGSTGHPKGVVLTHRSAMSAVYSWRMTARVGELLGTAPELPLDANGEPVQASGLVTTPLFHVSATHAVFFSGLLAGHKLILMYKWDAAEAIKLIERETLTRFYGVPTMSADLMEEAMRQGKTLDTLRSMEAGGAKRPAGQVGQLAKALPHAPPSNGFGMTETNALGIFLRGDDYIRKPNATGRLYPPLQELKIVDDDGHEVPQGEIGELILKSAANMRCYLNKPEATAETLKDGWLYTGDLAYIDDEDIVTIVDRKKDMIIRGGENISCLEVDAAMHLHPDVLEASVFSMPDERLGEAVGAGVMLKPGAQLSQGDLQAFLKQYLAAFKIPERIWFQTEPLPRGGTEKTDRNALRKACIGVEGSVLA